MRLTIAFKINYSIHKVIPDLYYELLNLIVFFNKYLFINNKYFLKYLK